MDQTRNIARRDILKGLAAATVFGAWPGLLRAAEGPTPKRPNILFIAVDDLRPELGCYGHPTIKSPNIDRLASRSLVFERAYCQQAICMSSRASLLSGYRPDKGKIYRDGPLYEAVPDALSLNRHFLNNGYEAVGMGKIYHHSGDMQRDWTRKLPNPRGNWVGRGYLSEEAKALVKQYNAENPDATRKGIGPAFEAPDVADNAYADGQLADSAIAELRKLKDSNFFLAVGFMKPHLPFNAPKKYWDLYNDSDIQLAKNPFSPKGAPKIALHNSGELRLYNGIPKEDPVPDDLARNLVHGYYACVSYVDAMIGRVLDELDNLGLRDNTIVVLWGDHGWKLGEHAMWNKHTNFEIDTRSALMVSVPGMKAQGKKTRALVEFVDIYPTLCELAGIDLPGHLEGTSMAPLLNDPELPWKKAAFSQFPRGDIMGYSMRTDRFRYTEWQKIEGREVIARELYDHANDPQENINIAELPENSEQVAGLARMLRDGYAAARP